MRLFSTAALSLVLAATAGLVLPSVAVAKDKKETAKAPAQGEQKDQGVQLTLGENYKKAIIPVQKAMQANNLPEAKTAMDAAESTALSEDESYHFGVVQLQYSVAAQDKAAQKASLERLVKNSKTPMKDLVNFEQILGQTYLVEDRNFPDAVRLLQSAIDHGVVNGTTYYQLAEAKFSMAIAKSGGRTINTENRGLAQEGLADLQKAVELPMADGSPTPDAFFDRGYSISQVVDPKLAEAWGTRLLKHNPSKDSWHSVLLNFYSNYPAITRQETLDLFRLMRQAQAMTRPNEFDVYADAAQKAGLPGEAKSLIDWGRTDGTLSATQLADLYKLASDAVVKDRASIAASEASANKAATGRPAANTGDAYLSYGEDAKAAAMYRVALEKGDVDADVVNTRLGIALARSGDRAGAQAAFAGVTGTGSPLRKSIADLWTVWLTQNS